jgi:N utilization substance protein B
VLAQSPAASTSPRLVTTDSIESPVGKRRSARELALKILFQVDVGKLPLEEALANSHHLEEDDPEVHEFAETLVRGAVAEQAQVDEIISRYASGWALERMANVDRNLLRLALYELLFLEDIPTSVSINEAVDLAKIYSTAESGRFINGILGNFVRQGEAERLTVGQPPSSPPEDPPAQLGAADTPVPEEAPTQLATAESPGRPDLSGESPSRPMAAPELGRPGDSGSPVAPGALQSDGGGTQ